MGEEGKLTSVESLK